MRKIVLPELGQGIDKASVSFWFFKEGDAVKQNEDLVELTTDKAAFNLPSPCSGKIVEILFHEGDQVRVGETLCVFEENS